MQRIVLRSKIHRACVTDANLEYEGSISIDRSLMEAAEIGEYEKVLIANLANGERIETYVIAAAPGSRTICLNGAAAHKFSIGDRVIIMAFGVAGEGELPWHQPRVVLVDEKNEIVAGPKLPRGSVR